MGRAVSNVYGVATERYLEPVFEVDGVAVEGSFDLWAQEHLEEIVLKVKLRLPDSTAVSHFKDCDFNLVEYSRESRRSQAHKMVLGTDDIYVATRTIKKSEELGSLKFHVVAVRKSGKVLDSIASAVGVVVGQSEPRYVHVDEGPERSGNFLRVKWVDFDKHYPSLRRNSHHLVFEAGLPYLALNSQLVSWRTVMESKGNRGPRAAMRDHAYAVIVTDVWSMLLTRTLARLNRILIQRDEFDPSVPGLDPINDLEWWEGKLLSMWMPRHYRLGADDPWKQRLFDDLKSGGPQQHQVSATIQRHAQLGDEFEKIVHISLDGDETP